MKDIAPVVFLTTPRFYHLIFPALRRVVRSDELFPCRDENTESCPGHRLCCVIDRSEICLLELRELYLAGLQVVLIMKFRRNLSVWLDFFQHKTYYQCILSEKGYLYSVCISARIQYETNWA